MAVCIQVLLIWVLGLGSACLAQEPGSLNLERKIALPNVKGRIDHLALDLAQRRIFVAALENNTVEVVDLDAGKVAHTLKGLDEPQGIAYRPQTQVLYVANGGDGSLRTFSGLDLKPLNRIELGTDADNVRLDETGHVYVGHGTGAIAVIEEASHAIQANVALKGHPESFQLESSGSRIFVNVPDAREISVLDRGRQKQTGSWPTGTLRANYAMALDETNQRLLASFRQPATLAMFDLRSGERVDQLDTCGDADDVFIDRKRNQVYVACGEGFIDVIALRGGRYLRIAQVNTVIGARTALYSADLDRLFLAVRARGNQLAAIWIYRAED